MNENLDPTGQSLSTAEKEIENAAVEDGILDQAGQNTEYYLERLLNSFGYPEVVFILDFAPTNGE